MPGVDDLNLSHYHCHFLHLPACLIKLSPHTCTQKANFSGNFPLYFFLPTSFIFLGSCFLFSFNVLASCRVYKKCMQPHFLKLVKTMWLSPYTEFVTLGDFACICIFCQFWAQHHNNGWGCCFMLLDFPPFLLFFLFPSNVPICPFSKCQQNLGTWSGIWCHINPNAHGYKKPHSTPS